MAIGEQVIAKMMQTLTGIEEVTNGSSVVDLSLSLILPEHPWTVEYALIGSTYSSTVLKSWTRSIKSRNWTDVSITFCIPALQGNCPKRKTDLLFVCCILMNCSEVYWILTDLNPLNSSTIHCFGVF